MPIVFLTHKAIMSGWFARDAEYQRNSIQPVTSQIAGWNIQLTRRLLEVIDKLVVNINHNRFNQRK